MCHPNRMSFVKYFYFASTNVFFFHSFFLVLFDDYDDDDGRIVYLERLRGCNFVCRWLTRLRFATSLLHRTLCLV
jgi:hypothetical protein